MGFIDKLFAAWRTSSMDKPLHPARNRRAQRESWQEVVSPQTMPEPLKRAPNAVQPTVTPAVDAAVRQASASTAPLEWPSDLPVDFTRRLQQGFGEPLDWDPGRAYPEVRAKILKLMYERPDLLDVATRNRMRLWQKAADPKDDTRARQKWNRMTTRFIDKVLMREMGEDLQGLSRDQVKDIMGHEAGQILMDTWMDYKYPDRHTWKETIRKAEESKAASLRQIAELERSAYREEMTPLEYEAFCADLLKSRGWQTELTKSSGDQGVDVVAKKGTITLAIQVKKYSSPVGNYAVQEVYTGRAFYGATHAAVVSNAPYTPAAQELARSAGVVLLHHDDLAHFAPR